MKKQLLLLSLLVLTACSNATSSSTFDPKPYFAAMEAAARADLAKDDFSLRLGQGKANMAFDIKDDEGTVSPYSVRIDPLLLDVRFSNIHAESCKDVTMSMRGKDDNGNSSNIYLEGDNLPASALISGGLPFAVHAYLEEGVGYLNLYDAAALRLAINEMIKQEYPSYAGLPIRGKKALDEKDVENIDEYFPLDQRLLDTVTKLRENLEKINEKDPNDFHFNTEASVQSITFRTTSWDSFRRIVDDAAIADMSLDSVDMSSFFDEAEANADLKAFALSLSFDEQGWKRMDFEITIGFKTQSEGTINPKGDWNLTGGLIFGHEKALTLSDKEKQRYEEITLPEQE